MSTPYKPVSWGNEYISADKLNVMASNDQYLFERTPTVYYKAFGVSKRAGGMKIIAGIQVFGANKKVTNVDKDYHFGNFFSQGCHPIVTTSLSMATPGRYHVVISGLGKGVISPDHRGMNLRVIANAMSPKDARINTKIICNWIAVGW